jgi:hypothetical protein
MEQYINKKEIILSSIPGDVFPKGDCINSQRCDLTSGTFKLVSVPATKTCSADEWCVLNGLGEYNCAKKPGKSNDSLEKNVLYLRKFIPF